MLSPIPTSTGTDSPVNADVSIIDLPSIIFPSNGTFSPGFTTIVSPIFTSSGDNFSIFPFFLTYATSGLISIKLAIDFLDLSTA